MKIQRTTTPDLPITKAELRKHANLPTPDFDGELSAFAYAAVDDIQTLANAKLSSAEYTIYRDAFEDLDLPGSLFPVSRIKSITYLDANGTEQTLDASLYQFDAMDRPQRLLFTGSNLPTTVSATEAPINPVRIHVVAGYGDGSNDAPLEFRSMPNNLLLAIKQLTIHRFLHREAVGAASMLTKMPYGIGDICRQFRKRRVR